MGACVESTEHIAYMCDNWTETCGVGGLPEAKLCREHQELEALGTNTAKSLEWFDYESVGWEGMKTDINCIYISKLASGS